MIVNVILVFFMLTFTAAFIALARYIDSGQGDGLIAGYGSASEDEKDEYDVKRVRRVVSMALYFVAAILPLFAAASFLPDDSAMLVILLLVLVMIVVLVCGVVCGDKWSRRK